jgi:DNA-binding MarR family transcriptional regulator
MKIKRDRLVGSGLARIHRAVNNRLEKLLKPLGICRTDFAYLFFLEAHPGSTQEEIREYVGLDKAIVTRIIKRLEARDLLKRKRCQHDKRAMNVFLTDNAKEILPRLHSILDEFDSAMMKGFSQEEINVLVPFLNRILDNLRGKYNEQSETNSGKYKETDC